METKKLVLLGASAAAALLLAARSAWISKVKSFEATRARWGTCGVISKSHNLQKDQVVFVLTRIYLNPLLAFQDFEGFKRLLAANFGVAQTVKSSGPLTVGTGMAWDLYAETLTAWDDISTLKRFAYGSGTPHIKAMKEGRAMKCPVEFFYKVANVSEVEEIKKQQALSNHLVARDLYLDL